MLRLPDLVIHLKNDSDQAFQICSPWLTACQSILPGAQKGDGMVTDGKVAFYADYYLDHYIAKACGHLLYVRSLVASRTDEPIRRNMTAMKIVVSAKSIEAACRAADKATPPGSADATVTVP